MAVYMVQAGDDGLIKIGYAENVAGRLVKMRADCPASLSLIGQLDGGRDLESELHKKFKAHKSHGEWFFPDQSIIYFAQKHAPARPKAKRTSNPIRTPASELIEQLGGNRVLCERFRQEQPTISNWRRRGIPWRWRPAIADLAKQQNVEIPDGFLDPIEAA